MGLRTLKSVFICGSRRAGTSFSTEYLQASGVLGATGREFFTPPLEVLAWQSNHGFSSYQDYLEYVLASGTTPNGVFGMKLHGDHLSYLTWRLRALRPDLHGANDLVLLQHVFPGLSRRRSFVYIWRKDLIGQTVSRAIAEQTGSWNSRQAKKAFGEPEYDANTLMRFHESNMVQHQAWQDFFRVHGIRPLVLEYSQIAENPREVLGRVFGHTDITCPPDWQLPRDGFKRQANDLNELWRSWFLKDLGDMYVGDAPLELPPPRLI